VTWSRREVLTGIGVGASSAILFACGGSAKREEHPQTVGSEITTWLRDAVAVLVAAGFASPQALAVTRRRTTAALDVLGAGVGRGRTDGVVLSVRDKDGIARELVTNDLSRDGIANAVEALVGAKMKPATVDFGRSPTDVYTPSPDPATLSDADMLSRVAALAARDRHWSSRIVYAASVLDIDDTQVWSVARGQTRAQRLVRVRRSVTRVAWHGSRPFVSEATRAWMGGVDAQDLTDDEIIGARENALALMTPRPFAEGEYTILLEPTVAASVIDAALRGLLTRDAQRLPEVARRAGLGAAFASALFTVVDDPSVTDAYGGHRFDDRGLPASAVTLIDQGKVVGRIDREQRPGHIGRGETTPSHVRVSPGMVPPSEMLDEGLVLEEPIATLLDPSSDRVVVQVARGRELVGGRRTGRIFADLEVVGELGSLLSSVMALSTHTQAIGIRDESDGHPRWRSIETPSMRAKAIVRQRRRQI
jgi:predicted Zn-dependent protease